jgi:hypothetical protein
MSVQSIIFDKELWTPRKATNWLMLHNFYPIKKVHETEHYYRFRIQEPRKYAEYMTKTLPFGIKLILFV